MKNLCVVIPTHNRHQYLTRCINYYSKFDCRVIICDSSAISFKPSCNSNVSYCHLPGKKFSEKIMHAVQICNMSYIALSPDDDFLFESALYDGLNVLEHNAKFQACVGDVLGFPDTAPFQVVSKDSGHEMICATVDDLSTNIQNYLFNYHQILWSLFRKDTLSVCFQVINNADFKNENFIELTIAAICAGRGGIYYLEDNWILRELSNNEHWGSKHLALPYVKNLWETEDAVRYMQLVDSELFSGASELALNSYLKGQKRYELNFMQRLIAFARRHFYIKKSKKPILPDVRGDKRFLPIIEVIEGGL